MAEARAELNVNPTITVYDIGPDGQECRRRPANPFARLTFAFSQMVDAAMRFQPRFEALAVAAIEKNRVWR
ncbi:hypothetical protein [Arthrobacter sp. SLBN-53]|uniref:hypothetical protein n=1 Tax=Arthrobacter sp. SLBN-53 TaxID=2768412 RepID=UPI00114F77BA|nr:hypothetical protein [Arthrobacter sp. SLBN-53]TQK29405.1 hypothetical protein FBY28_2408 [Arthrobacter sp. SLBN-53]